MRRNLCNVMICLGLILGLGGTSVYAYSEVAVENHFSTGIVDIELEEYTIQDGKEVLWKNDVKNILPGQDVHKIPRISNEGNDCYIRVAIDFVNSPLTMDSIYGISENWHLASDGYYYYRDVLTSGESVDLFNGFKIPTDFDQNMELSMFEIHVRVEAVQSNNFTPNYELDNPWGNVEIVNCMKEGMYDLAVLKKPKYLNFNIKYEGSSEKLIKNEKDFFENFPVLLPGDVYHDQLEIVNESSNNVNLYFRTKEMNGTELLDEIKLKIKKFFDGEETIIYDGTIRGTDLQDNILLASLDPKETGNLFYEIYVPEYLDNNYTLMEDEVIWLFSTKPVKDIDTVQTGDYALWASLVMLGAGFILITSGIGIGILKKVRVHSEK